MFKKQTYIYILIIGGIITLVASTYILYEVFRPKGVCKLDNETGVCYINSTIQSLLSCQYFATTITKKDKSQNPVVYNLVKLIKKIKSRSHINPLPYYKKIFNDHKNVDWSKRGNDPAIIYEYLARNIATEFPDSNLFLSYDNCEKINPHIDVPSYYCRCPILENNTRIGTSGLLQETFNNSSMDKSVVFSQIIIIKFQKRLNNFDFSTCEYICDPEVTINSKKYSLRSIIVRDKVPVKVKRTKILEDHSYVYGMRCDKWYCFNDVKVNKIKQENLDEKVFKNELVQFAVYEVE